MNDQPPSIRDRYAEQGVEDFYAQHGGQYANPHEDQIRDALARCVGEWQIDLTSVLDLACGSGEITLALRELGAGEISATDPYTGAAYRERTGQTALSYSFEQIAAGALGQGRFATIVCSYALHLLEPSRLPGLLAQLAQHSPALLILSPHKRPEIRSDWGWELTAELYHRRVRARLFSAAGDSL